MQPNERPTHQQFADHFVMMDQALIDNPHVPVHERWEFILTHIPEVRGRRLYENFEDALQRIYEKGSAEEVYAARELANLTHFFYKVLMSKDIGRSHANGFHIVNTEKWAMKFADKLETMKPGRFKRGKYQPQKTIKVTHQWIN
jgi:hypothetical protein